MSCESPFTFFEGETVDSPVYTMNYGVSNYPIPGYSIPSYQVCLLGCDPAHCAQWGSCCSGGVSTSCHWGGWKHTKLECSSYWNSCEYQVRCCKNYVNTSWYWYDCSTIPAIPIFPTLIFSGTATASLQAEIGIGDTFSVEGENPSPIASLTISDIELTFNLSAQGITPPSPIKIPIPFQVGLDEIDGSFSVSIPLGSYGTTFVFLNTNGVTINCSLTQSFSILFCLDPVPPQGWVNIECESDLAMNFIDDGTTTTLSPCSFDLVIPIVSLEEGD